MLVFLLDCLRFSKLLKLHRKRRITSNLLKRKQSSRKTSIVCHRLNKFFFVYMCMYVCVCVCVYIYIYTHTYTYTTHIRYYLKILSYAIHILLSHNAIRIAQQLLSSNISSLNKQIYKRDETN